MRVLIACAVITSIAASPRSGRADGIGVVAVSLDDRAGVAAAMAQAVSGRANRVVDDAVAEARVALAAGAIPIEAVARFRRTREQIGEGWRAFLRVAVELAASRLAVARTEAEPLVALPGGAELYADAALRLGGVLGHLGRKDEAQAVLALAVALDPDRPITVAEFSPDLVEAVEAARTAPVALKRVRITTTPAGASIRIDGKDVGRSPLDVQVTRGQHLVVARSPLHRVAVQGLPTASTEIELLLEPDEDAARISAGPELGMAEPLARRLVDATVRYADLDELVLVADTTRRGGPTLLVQRCAGIPARCSAVVEMGYADRAGLATAAAAAWQAASVGELRYPPTVFAERDAPSGDRRCRLCRNPWLWTGVGAAVAIGTVLTIMATSSDKPAPIVGIDPGQF